MMFVIVCYDVQPNRDSRIQKILGKYLEHVQRSVFEGNITDHMFRKMCHEIQMIIHPEEDVVVVYHFDTASMVSRSMIGNVRGYKDGFL